MLFAAGIFFIILGIGLWFILGAAFGRQAKLTGSGGVVSIIRSLLGGGSLLLGLIMAFMAMVVIIQPGEVGVQILFGSALPNVLREGFHIVNPFVRVVKMNVRTQQYTMSVATEEGEMNGDDSIDALTSDGLTVKLDVTVWYHLNPGDAVKVYRIFGPDYVSVVVRPIIRTAIRDAASRYNAVSIYSGKREEFILTTKSLMDVGVTDKGITIERVLLRNVALPPKVTDAIEEKLKAEQEAQKMEYVLQRERQEAERKRVEAQGIADAQKIINQTLSTPYLQYLYLTSLQKMAESQNTTFLITPYDQNLLPLVNLR